MGDIFAWNVIFLVYGKGVSEQSWVAFVYALLKCLSEHPGCEVVKENGFYSGGEK